MSDAPGFTDTEFTDTDDASCQRALAVLLDVGTSIVRELKQPTPGITVVARAAAYARASLAVRRTIRLAEHLRDRALERTASEARRTQDRKRVIRVVEDAIVRHAPANAEPLRAELLERIDSPDFEDDLAARRPEQVIEDLCRDLGVASTHGLRPPLRRTPDDIAILCAQAAAPTGSGLPQWAAAATAHLPDAAPAPRPPSFHDFLLKER